MTMTYCRTCQRDVHITHDCDEGETDLRVPMDLRGPPQPEREDDE